MSNDRRASTQVTFPPYVLYQLGLLGNYVGIPTSISTQLSWLYIWWVHWWLNIPDGTSVDRRYRGNGTTTLNGALPIIKKTKKKRKDKQLKMKDERVNDRLAWLFGDVWQLSSHISLSKSYSLEDLHSLGRRRIINGMMISTISING